MNNLELIMLVLPQVIEQEYQQVQIKPKIDERMVKCVLLANEIVGVIEQRAMSRSGDLSDV